MEKDLQDIIDFFEKDATDELFVFYDLLDSFIPHLYINTIEYEECDYTKVSFQESEKLVESFFEEFCPDLLDNLRNNIYFGSSIKFVGKENLEMGIETEKEFFRKLYDDGKLSEQSYISLIRQWDFLCINGINGGIKGISKDGQVNISLFGNIEDVYSIAHECTHEFFWQSHSEKPFNYNFLIETPSIVIELLLSDFLKRNGFSSDANNHMLGRFNSARNSMLKFHFSMILWRIYKKHHRLSEFLIDEAIKGEESSLKQDLIFCKQGEFSDPKMHFPYILGTLIACSIKDEVLTNPQILLDIGKEIYGGNPHETLSKIGADYFEESTLLFIFKKYKLNSTVVSEMCVNYISQYENYLSSSMQM